MLGEPNPGAAHPSTSAACFSAIRLTDSQRTHQQELHDTLASFLNHGRLRLNLHARTSRHRAGCNRLRDLLDLRKSPSPPVSVVSRLLACRAAGKRPCHTHLHQAHTAVARDGKPLVVAEAAFMKCSCVRPKRGIVDQPGKLQSPKKEQDSPWDVDTGRIARLKHRRVLWNFHRLVVHENLNLVAGWSLSGLEHARRCSDAPCQLLCSRP